MFYELLKHEIPKGHYRLTKDKQVFLTMNLESASMIDAIAFPRSHDVETCSDALFSLAAATRGCGGPEA